MVPATEKCASDLEESKAIHYNTFPHRKAMEIEQSNAMQKEHWQ
jgi:hypothetical protein